MADRDDAESGDSDTEIQNSPSLSDLADRVEDGTPTSDKSGDTASPAGEDGPTTDRTPSTLSELAESIRRKQGPSASLPDDEASEWDLIDDRSDTPFDEANFDEKAAAVFDLVSEQSNILVVGPAETAAEYNLCTQLMTGDSGGANQLLVSVETTPEEQLNILNNYRVGSVENQTLISVQSYDASGTVDAADLPITIKTVTKATDLRRIGLLITKSLNEWGESSVQSTLCVHSLSNLIAAVNNDQRLFRFLHILTNRVSSAGARAHYHVDPARHDDQTLRTFKSLFDAAIEFEADGSLSLG
ncbi:uncharacterized protein HfgLR_13755 [Haloferax gibbonsii]|uniref:KaiC-like domain-containing protein n=1 Tax=Haloferax gibbonsii TaxID=35746 RepID=A0A871BJ95_HALGI|nr:hypothetical protein [Haloferax gibbonsii]QOS12879.1 uncharacterized protein HfgLR_13755 [Haloferax gibbonsii]